MRRTLITNVLSYAGPGAVPALLSAGHEVLCHDASFVDPAVASDYARDHPGVICLSGQSPEEVHAAATKDGTVPVDSFISNDVHPNTPRPIEDITLSELHDTFEALLVFPFRLTQLLLPDMKARRSGGIVFITSARLRRPEPGYALATSIRAGSTGFALALAREVAPMGIQVNAVAPNYLYSEMYYPKAKFVDDPAGRQEITNVVPAGRLGQPQEIGELIEFLASGRSTFTTGQVIDFTGGWS